ncbi:MAG TPA: serine protease [Polyangiaceae bacterium]|nr:serine protease [Polyangiaceae bacterium]
MVRAFELRRWWVRRALASSLCLGLLCRCAPGYWHVHVVQTAAGRQLALTGRPPGCNLLITRSVLPRDVEVVARLTYTGERHSRDDAEEQLRQQGCKLGADVLLVEQERYGRKTEVLALALTRDRETSVGAKRHEDDGEVTGSCFAVDRNGTVVTAEHVIHDAKRVEIQFEGEDPIAAAVLERRPAVDVAVLKVERKATDFLPLVPSKSASAGDRVFTFGFPVVQMLGKEPKFSDGAVSALSGFDGAPRLMQVTIPIQPGNSGGPVVTETGFAIGIVVSTASALPFLKATGALPQGLNWAVKSELAMAAIEPADDPPVATDRVGAVARARHAACAVTAER